MDAGAPQPPVPRARGARGFTLLEVLVVVVIVAILTTLGVLSVGVLGEDREIEDETARYADVVEAALEQAQLEGRDYGIRFEPAGYEVLAYAPSRQRWESLAEDRLFEPHELPDGLEFALELEGRRVPLGREAPEAEVREPQVVLFASGDAAPYRLTVGRAGVERPWHVEGNPDGTLEITRPDAGP